MTHAESCLAYFYLTGIDALPMRNHSARAIVNEAFGGKLPSLTMHLERSAFWVKIDGGWRPSLTGKDHYHSNMIGGKTSIYYTIKGEKKTRTLRVYKPYATAFVRMLELTGNWVHYMYHRRGYHTKSARAIALYLYPLIEGRERIKIPMQSEAQARSERDQYKKMGYKVVIAGIY